VASPVIEGGQTLDTLRAEHGFAALVTITVAAHPRSTSRVARQAEGDRWPSSRSFSSQHPSTSTGSTAGVAGEPSTCDRA
jgi:hypothetical protein